MANEQNLRPPFSKDDPKVARDNQKKAVASRKRNKQKRQTIAEAVKELLDTEVKDKKQLEIIKKSGLPVPAKPKYRDFLIASAVIRDIQKGNIDTLAKYAALIGETLKDAEKQNGMLADLIDGLVQDD